MAEYDDETLQDAFEDGAGEPGPEEVTETQPLWQVEHSSVLSSTIS